jgi:uncharacterized protein YndB with AHSA1/START domain
MSREFACRREVELPASPEQVWEAVSTPAGNAAWLFPNEVPDPDGTPDASGTRITAWDPPRHLALRTEQGDWFNALEFVIEGRAGGTTLLRYAHSGIFVDDWDTQYDAVQQHTDFYLHTLGQYLQHFAGRPATYVGDVPGGIQAPDASAAADGFDRLQGALGLSQSAAEGDAVQLSLDGLGPLDGVIDYRRGNFLGIRTADGLLRFFGRNAFGAPVGVVLHLFTPGVDGEQVQREWQDWLNGVYAA